MTIPTFRVRRVKASAIAEAYEPPAVTPVVRPVGVVVLVVGAHFIEDTLAGAVPASWRWDADQSDGHGRWGLQLWRVY